jgi:hypothetical protein
MAKKCSYYFVNWIDGMKINKDHFIAMENAMICQQISANRFFLNQYNFGIMPGINGELSLEFTSNIDVNYHLNINIYRCKAMTAGGTMIDIDLTSTGLAEFKIGIDDFDLKSSESVSGQYYIVLKVNPFNRMPAGDADPDENPPRHPYVLPEYGLFIVPVEQMNKTGFGDSFLVIGKIMVTDNIPVLDKEYIPPCSRVSSDERLMLIENRINGFFNKLEADITIITRKIHTKQQKTPLATSVLLMADRIATFLGLFMTGQRLYLKDKPPVALFEAIVCFASFLRSTLNAQPTESKEELINYFSDWCNLKQGELDKLLVEVSDASYNHFETSASLSKCLTLIDTMSVLFGTLSTLDYIGKRRDTQIYIKEEEKTRKSFLADD